MIEPVVGPSLGEGSPIEDLLGPLTPQQLAKVPERLYYQGDRELLHHDLTRISIVGSRRATPAGRRRAAQLTRDLVAHDVAIVSRLAAGIDTAAHQAAIAQGGRTIAVLGTALDQCNPVANRDLQEEIGREHLLLTQLALGQKTGKWAFPARNRLMALISDATVIIEAGLTSGTQHQGWEAIRLNTPLLLAQSLVDRRLDWTEMMLDYGARPLTRVQDLLDVVAIGGSLEPLPF